MQDQRSFFGIVRAWSDLNRRDAEVTHERLRSCLLHGCYPLPFRGNQRRLGRAYLRGAGSGLPRTTDRMVRAAHNGESAAAAKCGNHILNRVGDCAHTMAAVKKGYWPGQSSIYDQRSGITPGAEAAAGDCNLTGKISCE